MVAIYAVMGALMFKSIELPHEEEFQGHVEKDTEHVKLVFENLLYLSLFTARP